MFKIFKESSPVLLVGMTILLLIGFSFLPKNLTIFGIEVKPVDLFMDIKPDSLLDFSSTNYELNLLEDLKASVKITLIEKIIGNNSNTNTLSQPISPLITPSNIKGNLAQMRFFYNALKSSKTRQVRIAHFADSGNEGDNITADMRETLQKRFGGNGVGFIGITSLDFNFRRTTRHSFSDNWKTISVLISNPEKKPLGINGNVAIPQGSSWVKYETTLHYSYLNKYTKARLFYSDAKASSLKYSFDNETDKTVALKTSENVQELVLTPLSGASSFKITTSMSEQANFFGVSLESSSTGVYVDNFPLRGNSGVSLKDIPDKALKDFNKILDYKLIILHFGLNMAGSRNYSWYEHAMTNMINDLKQAFPETSFLLVGVGDKGVKRGSNFVTDPSVPLILEAQEKIANNTGIAFWSLYEAMGGENSIARWVSSNPPLALKDYVHLTLGGYKKVANLMTDALISSIR